MQKSSVIKLPYDIEAEKSVIASILLDNESLVKVFGYLLPEDFFDPSLRLIYETILELYARSKPIDPVAIKKYLKKRDPKLSKTGPILKGIMSVIPLSINIEHYSSIVKEYSIRRKLISLSSDLIRLGLDENIELQDILNITEKQIFSISQRYTNKDYVHIKDLLVSISERFEDDNITQSFIGFSTGFNSLDNVMGGLHQGDLIIIAARPSVGKTAFMLEIARKIAVLLKKKILIFSLEMSKEQLADRLLSLQSDIPLFEIRMGNIKQNKILWERCYNALNTLHETEIIIDDNPGQSVHNLRSKCRKWHMELGIDIIFIDYLQLLQGRNRESRALEVSEISQTLKNIARELKVPVIAISQLSRAVEARNDKKPQLSDLRESGSIEQDADIVMFLHRESYYNKDLSEEDKNKVEVIIAKNRNGATGIVNLRFIDYCAKFAELDGNDDSF